MSGSLDADRQRFRPDELEAWAAAVFEQRGMPARHAECAARLMVRTDMRGRQTHGLQRLPSYVQLIDEGLVNPRPRMTHSWRDGAFVFEADGSLGHVAAPEIIALGLGALKQRATVLGVVRDIGHLGALGIHALTAAEGGAFCMLGQQAPAALAMPEFKRAAIGNNPLAFGCPVPDRDPLVFDMACSTAARGHILLAAREGHPIPAGWAVDETGAPTENAQRALRGALLPAGGHKGMGIAMMIEVLAGALSATSESLSRPRPQLRDDGGSARVGAFFWFVNPHAFAGREVFQACMAQWAEYYLASGKARLPGERGAALERAAHQGGLALSLGAERALRALGERTGVLFPASPLR